MQEAPIERGHHRSTMAEETVKERANRGRTKDDARVVSGRFAADDLFAFILPLTPETVLDATINLTIGTNFDCAILRNTSDVLYGVMTVTLWLNRCLSGAQRISTILTCVTIFILQKKRCQLFSNQL